MYFTRKFEFVSIVLVIIHSKVQLYMKWDVKLACRACIFSFDCKKTMFPYSWKCFILKQFIQNYFLSVEFWIHQADCDFHKILTSSEVCCFIFSLDQILYKTRKSIISIVTLSDGSYRQRVLLYIRLSKMKLYIFVNIVFIFDCWGKFMKNIGYMHNKQWYNFLKTIKFLYSKLHPA